MNTVSVSALRAFNLKKALCSEDEQDCNVAPHGPRGAR